MRKLFARLRQEFDHIDALINAQTDTPVKTFAETSSADIRSAFGSGLIPAMLFTQSASDWMIRKEIKGRIVNLSSDRAFQATDDSFIESVTSWALRGTTRAMAKHLAKKTSRSMPAALALYRPRKRRKWSRSLPERAM